MNTLTSPANNIPDVLSSLYNKPCTAMTSALKKFSDNPDGTMLDGLKKLLTYAQETGIEIGLANKTACVKAARTQGLCMGMGSLLLLGGAAKLTVHIIKRNNSRRKMSQITAILRNDSITEPDKAETRINSVTDHTPADQVNSDKPQEDSVPSPSV